MKKLTRGHPCNDSPPSSAGTVSNGDRQSTEDKEFLQKHLISPTGFRRPRHTCTRSSLVPLLGRVACEYLERNLLQLALQGNPACSHAHAPFDE